MGRQVILQIFQFNTHNTVLVKLYLKIKKQECHSTYHYDFPYS